MENTAAQNTEDQAVTTERPINPEVEQIIALADQIPAIAEQFRAGTVTPSQVQDLADAIKASAGKLVTP